MRFGTYVALAALLLPLSAGADTFGGLGSVSTAPFTLSMTPDNPAPFSRVTISLSSGTLPLTEALLKATVNGKTVYSGTARSFSVQLGGAGSVTTVHALVSVGGATYDQSVTIQPQDVSLIVEPIASAPPLYPGKPSIPIEGQVRLVAMASFKDAKGVAANPATFAYVWTIDGTEMADSSGIGKSSIIVASPLQYRAIDVSVAVTNPSTHASSGATLSLSPVDSNMRVYENDPLLGIRFDHAVTDRYTISGAESTLFAAPFSLPTSGGAPRIQWFLDGNIVQTGNSVTLRPAGSGQGSAALSLTASGSDTASATADLSLIFGSIKSSNFLGL